MADRPSTPPQASKTGNLPPGPLTPEQVRRMEENRLKAKALRTAADASSLNAPSKTSSTAPRGQKRLFSSLSSVPRTHRDASSSTPAPRTGAGAGALTQPKDDGIRPAKKFERTAYIEYDFSKMTDTKGGFLSSTDDPHNRAMRAGGGLQEEKPAHMTLKEWERHQLLAKLRAARSGPFEPGISVLEAKGEGAGAKKCRECGSLEIDWKWEEVFGVKVCGGCKERVPEKYSLLTKTEAREDYLLTDPELKDESLLPHLERPNPHKSNWNNMQLFLRFQVEEYAFSPKKWGSPEALDAEFEKRQMEQKRRKEKKFNSKLEELKKRTRVEAYKRSKLAGGEDVRFGDRIVGRNDRHTHEWGTTVLDPDTGMSKKSCVECGMEVEELEF